MKTRTTILKTIFNVSILTPFVYIIFFSRTSNLLISIPVLFLSLILLLTSAIMLSRIYSGKSFYMYFAFFSILVFLFSAKYLGTASDYIFVKFRQEELNRFVFEIKEYGKIYEMTNGENYYKSLNESSYQSSEFNLSIDTTKNTVYFLNDALIKNEINPVTFEDFKNRLISLGLMNFYTLKDGTISFTVNGFLDTCNGIAYSETGIKPESNECGMIIKWKKVSGKWYAWSTA